jgi:ribose 5-phosphate isomerase B
MRVALGCDHAGFELKDKLKQHLAETGISVDDKGTNSTASVDYPDYAQLVGNEVVNHKADYGILVCGSGIGMSIAANKIHGIRAVNAHNELEAQLSREHNDANVLALGGRMLDDKTAFSIVDLWLATPFPGSDRHKRRIEKVEALEEVK